MAAAAGDGTTKVEEYISTFPGDVQPVLESVRQTILNAVPGTGEAFRYQMPVVTLGDGYLVHWAGWKHHVGMYPVPRLAEPLEGLVAPYRSGKDSVKFPLRDGVPLDLVAQIAVAIAETRS